MAGDLTPLREYEHAAMEAALVRASESVALYLRDGGLDAEVARRILTEPQALIIAAFGMYVAHGYGWRALRFGEPGAVLDRLQFAATFVGWGLRGNGDPAVALETYDAERGVLDLAGAAQGSLPDFADAVAKPFVAESAERVQRVHPGACRASAAAVLAVLDWHRDYPRWIAARWDDDAESAAPVDASTLALRAWVEVTWPG